MFRHARRSAEVWIPANASVAKQFVVDAECTFVADWDNFTANLLETLHDLDDFLGEFALSPYFLLQVQLLNSGDQLSCLV